MHEATKRNKPILTRVLVFLSGMGMALFSALTIEHFFAANYPETIFEGSFCDISAFFNCDSSAYSPVSAILGVPLGYFGLVIGTLFALGALFPSQRFERTNLGLSLLNILGVVALLVYSVVFTGTLCLLCTGFYVFSAISFLLFWQLGADSEAGFKRRFLTPSLKHLAAIGAITLVGAWGFAEYHTARRDALSGGAGARVVEQFYSLARVEWPGVISPYWTARATERFEDAPIRIAAYADLLCPDCELMARQLSRLEEEFEGKLNIAFQFFPLDRACNDVVEKDLHPGACDVSYMAAHDPAKFNAIHDEIFANLRIAKASAEWREELGRRHGVGGAVADSATRAIVHRIIETGREYAQTSEEYAHGIRSTPTMIINNRMIIGTLPYEQLRAIFQALVDEAEGREKGFIESWEATG
jgi:uncharacterized membrane protein/protein-disulfide isomerase